MRIGFDAKRAFCNASGLGNYSRYTINALCAQYPNNKYLLYTPKRCDPALFSSPEIAEIAYPNAAFSKKFGAYWRSFAIANRIRMDRLDIFHGLSNELPIGMEYSKVKSVVTMHDLIFMRLPKLYPVSDRYIYYKKSRNAVKSANLIIAISEQTRRDLIELLNADERKIRTVYQGCHSWFYASLSDDEKSAVRLKYKLPEKFILSVGTVEERKNLLSTVRALHEGKIDIPLVIVGKQTSYYTEVTRYIQEKKMKGIFFLNYVASEDLPALYQSSQAFVYPSKYEGFGIPVLEALNSGVPVVTSRGGCLEETVGDGGLLADPNEQDEITEAVKSVVYDDELRLKLVAAGRAHAMKFREEETIPQLMKVYKELL